MYTIQDVAKACGVSVATVSRVINNSPNVSKKTRELVETTIKNMNYKVNMLGRNLRTMKTNKILVLIPDICNPFFAEIIFGIEQVLRRNGYSIMICNTNEDIETEIEYLEILKTKNADGAIIIATSLDQEKLSQYCYNYPIVQCSGYVQDSYYNKVHIDDYHAAYDATKYLIDKCGNGNIAIVGYDGKTINGTERFRGYKAALYESGYNISNEYICKGFFMNTNVKPCINRLMNLDKPPSGIFALSDIIALSVCNALKKLNVKIGKDVLVFGFDGIDINELFTPSLSTIKQPRKEIGMEAAEIILDEINNKNSKPISKVLEYQMVLRETTGD